MARPVTGVEDSFRRVLQAAIEPIPIRWAQSAMLAGSKATGAALRAPHLLLFTVMPG